MPNSAAPKTETEVEQVYMPEELVHRDDVGDRMGFWLFLYTEIFLFAVMFLLYAVYRNQYLPDFQNAAENLSTTMGAVNTVVLLLSSLTVVLAIVALQKNDLKKVRLFIGTTLLCAIAFMVIKGFEWSGKFDHGLFLQTVDGLKAGLGSELLNPGDKMLPQGEVLFYSLYFMMTGTHALHIIIGFVLILWTYIKIEKKQVTGEKPVLLENIGLYWHLVDVIWIFLFPLFYLIK